MESRRFLVAAVLSLAVLVLWQWLFPPPPPVSVESVGEVPASSERRAAGGELSQPTGADPQSPTSGSDDVPEAGSAVAAPPSPIERIAGENEESVVLEGAGWTATFSNRGGVLTSLVLRDRRDLSGQPLEMVRNRNPSATGVFSLVNQDGQPLAVEEELFTVERMSSGVVFRHASDAGVATKQFQIASRGEHEFLDVQVESTAPGWELWMGPGLRNPPWKVLEDRFQKRDRDVTYWAGGEIGRVIADKIEGAVRLDSTGVRWFSLQDKYFLSAVLPEQGLRSASVLPVAVLGDEENGFQGFEVVDTAKGESRPVDLALLLEPEGDALAVATYWGSKEYAELKATGLGLEETVHLGRLSFIVKPLLYGLRWLHENVTTNWGWCIVLMTILLRILLLPLTHTSFVSMQKMQQLNPQMEAIRAKYRPKLKDKQGRPNFEQQRKMNEEIQALFKAEKVSPAAGCLPLLLQMPIFFAFYQLLIKAVELWGAPWILWINDLSSRDPIWVLPLIMGATQVLQQRFMPTSPNPTQRMIMNTMPIFFTVFALNFPAGLVLYWLTNNILTIFQQAGYNRLKKAGLFGGEQPAPAAKEKS